MKRSIAAICFATLLPWAGWAFASGGGDEEVEREYVAAPNAPAFQTWEQADQKSHGCISCHTDSDRKTMHANPAVVLGCTDCHGGDATVVAPAGGHDEVAHHDAAERAHVLPKFPSRWKSSANPERSYTWLLKESPEFVRFVNPGDLRVAREACGACHLPLIQANEKSLMANAAMFWGAAAYNNGILPYKHSILGEAYDRDGKPAAVESVIPEGLDTKRHGVLPKIAPMPAWETVPPGDVFRIFERGGRNINNIFAEIGLPNEFGQIQRLEEPGRPDIRQSFRGPGTGLRVSIPVLNIHKTRLNDPFIWMLGTNDNPGDFRSSGCSACHVVYANDRDPRHSAIYAKFGNMGTSQQVDPTIPKNVPGHPLKHEFTRQIPTSQCMICHMHQPNMFINTMLGYTMWDYESDAPFMWPEKQQYPDAEKMRKILDRNPEEAAIRGKWGDLDFAKDVSLLNPQLKDTQFADYHGHGWNFRAIYKRDRKGNLLDAGGTRIADDDPDKWKKGVHLSSIHVDVGMQCVDCHFSQDNHGNGYMKAEVMGAVEIQCQDCHGTADALPTLKTSGPAASKIGTNLLLIRNPDGKKRFEWVGDKLIQRSAVTPDLEWTMSLVKDTTDPLSGSYNPKATRAHTMAMGTDELKWGADVATDQRAHGEDKMLCYSCHTSWTTSCGGCHLPIQANWKTERHKYEGGFTRNFATYNPQVARDEMFFLGKHGSIKGGKIAPVRSSSALVLSSTNINREKIYVQQPPVSSSGYSSQAFAPHYPHTERKTETKDCEDCHLSKKNDNNAIMAQLLLLGTKFIDFVGYHAWVGGDGEIGAVQVTEWDEPQAVIGSYLHRYAYPDWFADHQKRKQELQKAEEHSAGVVNCLQLRGEYLFAAEGNKGAQVYDVASIGNKGVSQKFVTAPASPLGQDTAIKSKNATCIALATTQPVAPERNTGDLMRVDNQEQPMHPVYKYAFITDAEEGLIATDIETLADREPRNNFLTRAMTWNENGVLAGARHLTIAGTIFYVVADAGVVVLDLEDPLQPRYLKTIPIADARASQVQFRYLFVTAGDGLHVVDVTHPEQAREVAGAKVALADAHKLHVARTFAYVANGAEGLAIIDVTNPEQPKLYRMFNAGGQLNDARDVIVGTTNASLFAYVADGRNGLKVIQLTSPELQPKFYGFAPDPNPQLIAWYPTRKPALSLSRGLERDRAVDESGHQVAVFGRIGSRPFNLEEMRRLFLRKDGTPWYVSNAVDDNSTRAESPATGSLSPERRPSTAAGDQPPVTPRR
ncbi:MAG TPA: multiheme c-type cytochrome [Dokdonella sp.]|nr:multiheme c-type cytochrome [Dokdonella sp.]